MVELGLKIAISNLDAMLAHDMGTVRHSNARSGKTTSPMALLPSMKIVQHPPLRGSEGLVIVMTKKCFLGHGSRSRRQDITLQASN
jgi:hypothetical protein